MIIKIRVGYTGRSFLLRLAWCAAMIFLLAEASRAGGPKNIAGTTYFDPTSMGQALVWPQGLITYYTDQGDLSPILLNGAANRFVANAFAPWTSVLTAAVAATSGGQLAEDVNGSNVTINSDGTISMPADIQPSATSKPVGIVYDYDGSVTDALMGGGAGDTSQCFSNAVFGGNDNYGTLATYQHALIVINGQCALQSSQLADVQYRLVRVIGGVFGVGWSQLNSNVVTGTPHPTAGDYAGFPVMHFLDPRNCVPITLCYPNPTHLAMDDAASLSRLYPVTAQNSRTFRARSCFRLLRRAFMVRCGSRTLTGILRSPCRASTWWRAGLIQQPVFLRASMRCRRSPAFYLPATQAIPSLASTTRWEILTPNGDRTAKTWKASLTSPACSRPMARVRNIS
jgi:hypothetical protein